MRLLLFIALAFCFLTCTTTQSEPLLSTANLASFIVRVTNAKDTIIRTPKGATIMIKRGTFVQDQVLEIKEAYSMNDIVLAGLVTESNGKPLRSGGMIYIGTKDKKDFNLKEPISVRLPRSKC